MTEIKLRPVGFVRNQSKEAAWGNACGSLGWEQRAARMKDQLESISELIFDPDFDVALDGIDEFSHLTVLYWAHLSPQERSSVKKVHPMGNKDFPMVGVFATHSPIRPNSILTTTVRLIERHDNVLKVTGLDALDGSPIVDIKPYHPYHEPKNIKVPEWMLKIHNVFDDTCVASLEKSDG